MLLDAKELLVERENICRPAGSRGCELSLRVREHFLEVARHLISTVVLTPLNANDVEGARLPHQSSMA